MLEFPRDSLEILILSILWYNNLRLEIAKMKYKIINSSIFHNNNNFIILNVTELSEQIDY